LQKKHLDISKQALGKRHELVEQRVFPAQASKQASTASSEQNTTRCHDLKYTIESKTTLTDMAPKLPNAGAESAAFPPILLSICAIKIGAKGTEYIRIGR